MKVYGIEKTKAKLYYCGSPPLKEFIESKGIIHVNSYVNKKTGRTIWIFILTDDLSDILTFWTNNRGNRGE